MTLDEKAKQISTRGELAEFLAALHADFATRSDWENCELGGFLEALAAWTADCDGYYARAGEPSSPWQVFADALLAARVYE
jgi:hypothetical protein